MSVEEAFAKVLGRAPSEPERERLYRLREALGLRDNDAFWSIVLALEHSDSFFRQYPAKLAEETARAIGSARVAMAASAQAEGAKAQRLLAERVAETSVAIARKLADRPIGLTPVTLALACVVAFGALCTHAGYRMATADKPFWAARSVDLGAGSKAFSVLLSMPVGWMVFALLVPFGAYSLQIGWCVAVDPMAAWRERALGACIVALCALGCAGCVRMLVLLA